MKADRQVLTGTNPNLWGKQIADYINLYRQRQKRANKWMQRIGLQLPSDASNTITYGSIGSVTCQDGEVKINSVPGHVKSVGDKFQKRFKNICASPT